MGGGFSLLFSLSNLSIMSPISYEVIFDLPDKEGGPGCFYTVVVPDLSALANSIDSTLIESIGSSVFRINRLTDGVLRELIPTLTVSFIDGSVCMVMVKLGPDMILCGTFAGGFSEWSYLAFPSDGFLNAAEKFFHS